MPNDCVTRVRECLLHRASKSWDYEQRFRCEIESNWQKRKSANPAFFNGRIFVMEPPLIEHGVLTAQMIEADFASHLHWKDHGYPDAGVRDSFGSALIRASGGEVLLARQRPGNLNSGFLYMPGGFIDLRDATDDGQIDIAASITRELKEETGLSASAFERPGGFIITQADSLVSIAAEFRSTKPAGALREEIMANLARQQNPELCDFTIFDGPPDIETNPEVAPFTQLAMTAVFAGL